MDNSLDRNQLWSPPLSRPYHLQGQTDFLTAQQQQPQPQSLTRRTQPGASQIQLEDSSYSRTHIPFPHPRYLSDPSLPPPPAPPHHHHHPHSHPHPHHSHPHLVHRSPYPIPRIPPDPRDNTPGPSHGSAEDDVDDYQNGNNARGPDGDGSSERGTRTGMDTDQTLDEEPLYVNAKQYNRILKRRIARARLEELHRLSKQRKPYLHESRHRHAMRRPRGPGGRFLTAEEIAAQQKAAQSADPGKVPSNPNLSAEERKALKASSSSEPTSNPSGEVSNPPSSSINIDAASSSPFPAISGGISNTSNAANGNNNKADFGTFAESPAGLAPENYPPTDNVPQYFNMTNNGTQ